MPLLSRAIYNNIVSGQLTDTDKDFNTFQLFLNFLNDLPVNKDNSPIYSEDIERNAIPYNANPTIKKKFYEKLIEDNHLTNIFNYLKLVTNNQVTNLEDTHKEKLLNIWDNFFKISLIDLGLSIEKIKNITKAFSDFSECTLNLPRIITIFSDVNEPRIFELLNSSVIYFSRLNKLNGNNNLKTEIEIKNFIDFSSSLKSFLRGLGQLTLNIRNESGLDLERFENIAVQLIELMTSLKKDDLSSARYAFLSQYHNNADILTECTRLFNTTNCDPYQFNTEYISIRQGKKITDFSAAEALANKLLFGSKNDVTLRLKTFSTTNSQNNENELVNLLYYFKATIKKANKKEQRLSNDFVKNLSRLAFYLTDVFSKTKPKSKTYDSLYSLVLNLLKNPSIPNFYMDALHAVKECADQMLHELADSTQLKKPQSDIDSSMKILADIFHQTMEIANVTAFEKIEIGEKIKALSLACIKLDKCSAFSALNQFSKTLGSMVRGLSKKNNLARNEAEQIEEIAKQIIQTANNTVSKSKLVVDLESQYLKGRYDNNSRTMQKGCQRIFNSSNCQIAVNQTQIQEEIFTTVIPKTTTPIVIQIKNITTELPSYSSTNSNQGVVVKESNSHDATNSELILGASAAHGAISGMLNGIIQYFAAKYSRRSGQSSVAKTKIIYGGLLTQAAFAATFPLMLYQIQEHINQGNEHEAQQLWNDLLLQAPVTFFSSITLNIGLSFLHKKIRPLLPPLPQTIADRSLLVLPSLGTIVSLFKNPVATGIQISTSIVSSSLAYHLLNWRYPIKNTNFQNIENTYKNNNVEMEQLSTVDDIKATANGNLKSSCESVKPKIEKTYQYITKNNFDKIREDSKNIIKLLGEFANSLENSIKNDKSQIYPNTNPDIANAYQKIIDNKTTVLDTIKKEIITCSTEVNFLSDDHQLAYKEYNVMNTYTAEQKKKIKKDHIAAMEKLGNVFKRMEPMFNNMKISLGKVHGYIEGTKTSFDDDIPYSLNKIMNAIEYPFCLIKIYINSYSTWAAGIKGETNGVQKTLDNIELFEKNKQPLSYELRDIKPKTSFYRPHSQSAISGSRTPSSGSERSSKDNENTQIIRPLLN